MDVIMKSYCLKDSMKGMADNCVCYEGEAVKDVVRSLSSSTCIACLSIY